MVLGLVAAVYLLQQARKPDRWLGRLLVSRMNESHAALTDWGLTHVTIGKSATILDIGCGGGRTIERLAAAATDGKVYGVDYAAGSVAASRSRNAQRIEAGRVEIREASVSKLPFPDGAFDLVTAVETHYYWPDLAHDMQEALRVVKPGGALAIIAEAYKSAGVLNQLQGFAMKALRAAYLTADQHRALLAAAGFSYVQVFEESRRGWICVVGRRPPSG